MYGIIHTVCVLLAAWYTAAILVGLSVQQDMAFKMLPTRTVAGLQNVVFGKNVICQDRFKFTQPNHM